MQYLIKSIGKNGDTYSIDKVLCKFRLAYNSGQDILDTIGNQCLYGYKHWESRKVGTYRDQFSFCVGFNDSFFLGVGLNTYGKLDSRNVRLEYNPNKVGGSDCFKFVFSLCYQKSLCRVHIKQFDLAVDLPVERSKCELQKDRRLYEEICHSDNNRTQYLGQRNSAGRVKLYNKQLEQKGNEPLTRLELTIDFEDSDVQLVRESFPTVRVDVPVQSSMSDEVSELNDTDLFILNTLINEPRRISELSRRKRDKLVALLDKYQQPIEFDDYAYSDVHKYLLSLLNGVGGHTLTNVVEFGSNDMLYLPRTLGLNDLKN